MEQMPTAHILEKSQWKGCTLTVRWYDAPYMPPCAFITQASGFCFTRDGAMILARNGDEWTLPGGHPESQERPEQTLIREVYEEVCCRVLRWEYLGCQRVEALDAVESIPVHYQTRFWARVEELPFTPIYEVSHRKRVEPPQFLSTLAWGHTQIARHLYHVAMGIECRFKE